MFGIAPEIFYYLQWLIFLALIVAAFWLFIWGFNWSYHYIDEQKDRMSIRTKAIREQKELEQARLESLAKIETDRARAMMELEVSQARLGHDLTVKEMGIEQEPVSKPKKEKA